MFQERLKEIRERNGVSQKELASKIGVLQQHISRWERGERTPSLEKIIDLCKALECTADELLGLCKM